MIETVHEDLLKSDTELLVDAVNCVGVMGKGIALQFKKAFPENFKSYKSVCDRKDLQLLLYEPIGAPPANKISHAEIIN